MPDEAFFFIKIQNFLALAEKLWGFGVLLAKLSPPIFGTGVHVFEYSTVIFTKKLSLCIDIPNIYLGLGFEFEFGPQRIRDLAIVCL